MTPPTYIYMIIWSDRKKNKIITYTGITNNINRRIKEHLKLIGCQTTKKFIKSFGKPISIRYIIIANKKYEKTFKKYSIWKKLKLSANWDRWAV